jgi:hypothetical protein
MVACLFSLISFKILSNRKNRREQKTHRNAEYENAMLQFSFMPKVDTCNFFKKTLENIGYKTEKKRSSLKIKDKNALLVFNFGFDQVSKTDVVKAYNLKTLKDTVYLIAENFNTEVKNFASRFYNLVLVDGEKIYSFLKERNSLPQIKYSFKEKRLDKIKALKSLLNRKNFKCYIDNEATFGWCAYAFPRITTTETLKELDLYTKERLRALKTGKNNKANYRKMTEEEFHDIGWVSLVQLYYLFKKDFDYYCEVIELL